ncbi:MAG: class I SAM-dependent methyltransferase [Acidimicrobiales bacterium]
MDDVVNTEQAEHWNAERTRHWVDQDEHHRRMLQPFTSYVLDAAAVEAGARVVDVGCGCGHTTRAAASRAAPGDVLGVDLSGPMLARARQLADDAGLGNVRFEQADAQAHSFPLHGFDAAISRFGVMFFDDPVAAFANIRTALDDGGRCAFVCWQPLGVNPWLSVPTEAMLGHVEPPEPGDPDAPGPFSLADPDCIRSVLDKAGFADIGIATIDEPLWLGHDPVEATNFLETTGMARSLLDPAPPDARARAVAATRDALEYFTSQDGVLLGSAAWLVHARRA